MEIYYHWFDKITDKDREVLIMMDNPQSIKEHE